MSMTAYARCCRCENIRSNTQAFHVTAVMLEAWRVCNRALLQAVRALMVVTSPRKYDL
jgi:hypothetical protein